jgi:hypothetical protein
MPEEILSKEPAFFSGLKKSRFKKLDRYMKIFEAANENHKWVGEASTSYLTDPVSAKRIYEYSPNAKIIIILRDPASRSYSLYNWMVQEGYEYAESFEEALELEEIRLKKKIPNYYEPEYYYNYLYFKSGLYYEQVKRFVDLFGENVLILKFEDYIKSVTQEWRRIYAFLNVKPVEPDLNNYKFINESKQVHSSILQFVLRKTTEFCLANQESLKEEETSGNLATIILKQARYDFKRLLKKKKISFTRRSILLYRLKKCIEGLHVKAFLLSRDSKRERDKIIKLGQLDKRPAAMKIETFKILQAKYKADLSRLLRLTGINFQ